MPAIIPPGQKVSIRVSVDPTKLAAGAVDKYVWVFLQGHQDPSFTLEMTGSLTQPVDPIRSVWPDTLNFGTLPLSQTVTRTFVVTWDASQVPAGEALQPVCADPDVQIRPTVPAEDASTVTPPTSQPAQDDGDTAPVDPQVPAPHVKTQEYSVTLAPQTRLGLLTNPIHFVLASSASGQPTVGATTVTPPGSQPLFEGVGLIGEVVGVVRAVPGLVFYGQVPQGQRLPLPITVTDGTRGAVVAASGSPYITVRFADQPDPAQVKPRGRKTAHTSRDRTLWVTLSESAPVGPLNTQVTLTAPDGEQAVLAVSATIVAANNAVATPTSPPAASP